MNIDKAITYAESIVRKSLNYFYDCFPTEQSENLVFKKFENVSWTTGFYEGILWLMYELTGDKAFYNSAKHHSEMFHKRLVDRVELEHHDMGFLFTLSSVADSFFNIVNNTVLVIILEHFHTCFGFVVKNEFQTCINHSLLV